MSAICPPYIGKLTAKLQKDVVKAERKELKAKKNYEYQVEYTKLCKTQLENAKKEDN